MIEIPEARHLAHQSQKQLANKRINKVYPATSEHKFAFFNKELGDYGRLLEGKKVLRAHGHGMFVDLHCEGDAMISISEGAIMRYHEPGTPHPKKFQLLIEFEDASFLAFSVAMYGCIWACQNGWENPYYAGSLESSSPLEEAFDEKHFDHILGSVTRDLSLKALLATEQRIPGLGNGALQDVLFNAGLHPRRKMSTLDDFQRSELFHSLKVTLDKMCTQGGRDTEKDLFGEPGAYQTYLSKISIKHPCRNCGSKIIKQSYMGGAIYFCPSCQPL